MGFLIDTCIWIDVERGAVAPADVAHFTGEEPVFLSPLTMAELTFGVEMSKDQTIRLKRSAALDRLRKKPMAGQPSRSKRTQTADSKRKGFYRHPRIGCGLISQKDINFHAFAEIITRMVCIRLADPAR